MTLRMKRVQNKQLLAFLSICLGLAMSQWCDAGTVTYVYTDTQGTPIAEANSARTITATYDYKPFGSEVNNSPPDGVGFTGQISDPSSGLVYMQARYYDPDTGRFLSTDPDAARVGDFSNFNRFGYAELNPVRYTDPNGMEASDEHDTGQRDENRQKTEADPRNAKTQVPVNVTAFVSAHIDEATEASKKYGTSMIIILTLGGVESGWGNHPFALNGYNFFGLQIKRANANVPFTRDVMVAKKDPTVGLLKFHNFNESVDALLAKRPLLAGQTDPEKAAHILQDNYHFGIKDGQKVPTYVPSFVKTYHTVERAVRQIQGGK